MDDEDAMTVADYLSALRRRWGIIVIAALLGALVAGAYLARAHPDYESAARLVINPVSNSPDTAVGTGGGTGAAATLIATQKSILRSDEVTERAADLLGDGTTPTQLRDASTVEVVPDSLTLDVTYEGADPASAQAGAQALVESYLEVRGDQAKVAKAAKVDALAKERNDLQAAIAATSAKLQQVDPQANPTTETVLTTQLQAQYAQLGKVQTDLSSWQSLDTTPGYVVTPASLPENHSGVSGPLVLIGVIVVAMVLGCVVALLYDSNDRTVRSVQELARLFRPVPVHMIADDDGESVGIRGWFGRSHSRRGPGAVGQAGGPEAESYRRLALGMGILPGISPRYLLVTSVGSGLAEEVAANLSVAMGREGARVLLIWSNPREDTLDAYFSVPPGPGLGEVLSGLVKIEDAVLEIPGCQGLSLLPVGSREEAREELFRFPVVKEALGDPDRVHFDQVVVIAPSSAEYADALALAAQVDGVLVATELGSTDRHALATTLDGLNSVDARLAGVVAL